MTRGGRAPYSCELKCGCGNTGKAHCEENETPPHRQGHNDRKLLNVDGNFSYATGYDPNIYCGVSKARVDEG